ncbi:MAG: DNA polymerase IV [Abitibacteriaceae bacterium]|nr:DNA polymerase IV [Abditibacteriaceae bacterium]
MYRTFIHVDLDAFYCAIEEQRDPTLRGRPFAVGGQPGERGVVASCSYPARHLGVRSAMSMAQALTLCPRLIIVPSRHAAYRAASEQVMSLLRGITPLLEQLSIDEAFLDVTTLLRPASATSQAAAKPDIQSSDAVPDEALWMPHTLAEHIQQRIWQELGLPCSLGIATSKLVAKIATDYGKANTPKRQSPQAICVVAPGEEAIFIDPLPATALWGVGPKTAAALAALGISTIGEIARWPQQDLIRRFGQHGYTLSQHARAVDRREIVTVREAKSVSSETTFSQDVKDWEQLHATLQELVEDVAGTLQRRHLQGTTVKLKLRWSDFTTPTRQATLPVPTDASEVIRTMATQLLRQLWMEGQTVRLMGVGVSGISPIQQLTLWDTKSWDTSNNLTPQPF